MLEMYRGMVNSPETIITNNINAEDTIIYVLDETKVPEELPNLMTLGTGTSAETVKVLGVNRNTKALTVERGFQGVARSWSVGTVIARNFTEYDYNALVENVKTLKGNTDTNADELVAHKADYANKIGILFKRADWVSIKEFGAKGDGVTDDTTAIANAINSGKAILFPPGTYLVTSTIELPDNTVLVGCGFKSIIKTNNNNAFSMTGTYIDVNTVPTHKKNLIVKNIRFEDTTDNGKVVFVLKTVDNIHIEGCECEKIALVNIGTVIPVNVWDGTNDPNATAGMDNEADLSHNIKILGNKCYGGANATTCINLGYVQYAIVANNIIENYQHGIQWWGGDSNFSRGGNMSNPRWVRDVVIQGNTVRNVDGGGIWGSMGQHITIVGNCVEECRDVGIDSEGSFFLTVTGNTVRNATNACLATFFGSKDVVFEGNIVEQDGSMGSCLAHTWNEVQNTYEINITFSNNVFRYTGNNIGYIGSFDATKQLRIIGNTFVDVRIDTFNNNAGHRVIKNNTLLFTKASITSFYAITGGGNHNHRLDIVNNIIDTQITQPSGSIGIWVNQYDFNTNVHTLIENNIVKGFTVSINVSGSSANSGIVMRYIIKNNAVSGTIEDTSSAGRSKTRLMGNTDLEGQHYPYQIPNTGTWEKGQVIYARDVTAGGYLGWVCIASGTPGTWKGFGLIEE